MNPTFEAYAKELGRDPISVAVTEIEEPGSFQKWLDAKFETYLSIKPWDGVTPYTPHQLAEFREWVINTAKAKPISEYLV